MTGNGEDAAGRRLFACLTLFFGLLTLVFTYPLSTSPNTYLNELADARLVTWALAWNAHALVTDPLSVVDANIFFPNSGTLAYSEPFLGPAVFVAPLNWAGYPVLAYNVVLMASFVLSGVGAALWVRHLTGSTAGGLVAGLIWAFAPGKFDQIAHLHMMVGQWIPFALFFCSRYLESGRSRDLYATGAFAGLQFAFSMHYGVFFLPILVFYALAVALLLPASAARPGGRKLGRDLLIAGAVFATLAVPVALPMVWANDSIGLERDYDEILRYSARPRSFLSGSPLNRAPHVRWLHERTRATEANYFPGALPSLLAGFALFGLLPTTLREGSGALGEGDGGRPWARARRGLATAGATLATVALGLHVGGFVAAWQRDAPWAGGVMELCRATHPSLWAAVGLVVALLTMPPAAFRRMPRWRVYLVVVGCLAVLTYLLSYGPEVRGFGAQLGRGPYWLLYRFVPPFEGIRAAGRIGLLWILWVAALAGFSLARLEARVLAGEGEGGLPGSSGRRAATRRGGWSVAVFALLAVLVWEFRVWPLPHEEADPAADPADVWLSQQSGDFALVHAPIESGPEAWRETRHMLGSALHWKRLVNGYSGVFPADYRNLAAAAPLSPAFFEILRSDFPVRYLLVHRERLANETEYARLQRLLARNDDAVFVAQHGLTFVFEVPRDRGSGPQVRRRYTAAQLRGKEGIQFLLRGAGEATRDDVIVVAGWGDEKEAFEISATWQGVRVEIPPGFWDSLDGQPGSFAISAHSLVPLADTGAFLVSGFTADVQAEGAGVGVEADWLYQTREKGLQVHVLELSGARIALTREFPPTPEGALAFREFVASLPQGATVALTLGLDQPRPLEEAALDGIRMLGGDPPVGDDVLRLVLVGRKGALEGQALQRQHHNWAVIDIEERAPSVELMGIGLY